MTEDRSPASPAYPEVLGTPMPTHPTMITSTPTPLSSSVLLDVVDDVIEYAIPVPRCIHGTRADAPDGCPQCEREDDANLASSVILDIVTPREGQANGCDWCDLPSVVKVLENGWLYYGCYMHGVKWFPEAMRQVSTLSLVKVTVGPDSTYDEYTKIRRMANEWTLHLLRGNNLCTLHSLIKLGH